MRRNPYHGLFPVFRLSAPVDVSVWSGSHPTFPNEPLPCASDSGLNTLEDTFLFSLFVGSVPLVFPVFGSPFFLTPWEGPRSLPDTRPCRTSSFRPLSSTPTLPPFKSDVGSGPVPAPILGLLGLLINVGPYGPKHLPFERTRYNSSRRLLLVLTFVSGTTLPRRSRVHSLRGTTELRTSVVTLSHRILYLLQSPSMEETGLDPLRTVLS